MVFSMEKSNWAQCREGRIHHRGRVRNMMDNGDRKNEIEVAVVRKMVSRGVEAFHFISESQILTQYGECVGRFYGCDVIHSRLQ